MESRRSFVSRMNPCGLSAEKGCYIFAIFNMVFISTCLLACAYYVKWARDRAYHGGFFANLDMQFEFSLIIASLLTISFVFAVLLCFGVHKKRPSYIHAYFIYGYIEKLIGYLITPLLIFISGPSTQRNWHIAALVINVIYSLLLIVVYRAHKAMSSEATDRYKLMAVPLA